MKKILSMILALAMILSLGVTAFAADVEAGEISGNTSQSVTANYTGTVAGEIDKTYYVKIEWAAGENTLKYTNNQTTYTWDAEHYKYVADNTEDVELNGWSGSAVYTVTVTNQSNATIYATPSVAGVDGITASGAYSEGTVEKWAENKLTLTTAAVDAEGTDLTPGNNVTGTPQIGSVKVTVTVTTGAIAASGTVANISIDLTHA